MLNISNILYQYGYVTTLLTEYELSGLGTKRRVTCKNDLWVKVDCDYSFLFRVNKKKKPEM